MNEPIVAPPLLPIEVTNILRRRIRLADGISEGEAIELLDEFLTFPISIRNPTGLHRRALRLATALGMPAAYGAHYLALAEGLGCELWTDDQRLFRLGGASRSLVRWIGDFGREANPPTP